jgi:hypothetical protein
MITRSNPAGGYMAEDVFKDQRSDHVMREILAHHGGVILGTWGVLVKNADASR